MIISINQLSGAFENIAQDPAAYALARDIDRLADLLDPYEYRDYIGTVYNGDIAKAVNALYNDIVTGKADYIAQWLKDIIDNAGTDPRDKERAQNRLAQYNEYMKKAGRVC